MSLFCDNVINPTFEEMYKESKCVGVKIATKHAQEQEAKIPTLTDRELLENIYRELLSINIKLEAK